MTLATILNTAWDHFSGTETVTLNHTNTGGTDTNTSNVTALGRAMRYPDGSIVTNEKLWILKAASLGSNTPIHGDRIITAGSAEIWVIQDLDEQALATKWNCRCKKAVS